MKQKILEENNISPQLAALNIGRDEPFSIYNIYSCKIR
jgi:hypothetical protein